MTGSAAQRDGAHPSRTVTGAVPIEAGAAAPAFHLYRVFGLTIACETPLPHLIPETGDRRPEVTISFGPVRASGAAGESGLVAVADGAVLALPGIASFAITGGNRIVVDCAPDVAWRNVELYLLGSALGALLHQRGVLPLHANLVQVNGAAVAFLGHSGAGKSTLAAWFHDHGHPILGDDVCVVDFAPDWPTVSAGIPRLRLWREALERTGRRTGDYRMSFDDYDKYDVPTELLASREPLRLGALYLLDRAASDAATSITRLRGTEALDALVANTYRGAFLTSPQDRQRHLNQCLRLLSQVPIFRAEREWGIERFDAVADALRAHAAEAVTTLSRAGPA